MLAIKSLCILDVVLTPPGGEGSLHLAFAREFLTTFQTGVIPPIPFFMPAHKESALAARRAVVTPDFYNVWVSEFDVRAHVAVLSASAFPL